MRPASLLLLAFLVAACGGPGSGSRRSAGGDSVENGGGLTRLTFLEAKRELLRRLRAFTKSPPTAFQSAEAIAFIADRRTELARDVESTPYEVLARLPSGKVVSTGSSRAAMVLISEQDCRGYTLAEAGWVLTHELVHHFPDDFRASTHGFADEVAKVLFPEVQAKRLVGEEEQYPGFRCRSKDGWSLELFLVERDQVELSVVRGGVTDLPTAIVGRLSRIIEEKPQTWAGPNARFLRFASDWMGWHMNVDIWGEGEWFGQEGTYDGVWRRTPQLEKEKLLSDAAKSSFLAAEWDAFSRIIQNLKQSWLKCEFHRQLPRR